MNNSTISIIIPTYNRRHLIGTTIDNLLQQTHPAHEIIVVDDHSTDGTVEWLNTTYGNKLIVLTNKGKGPGAARNTGFQASTGNYIKFFDSDDLMTRNHLENQLSTIIQENADAVYSPFIMATIKNGHWKQMEGIFHSKPTSLKKGLKTLMINEFFIPIPSLLFKRSLVEKIGQWEETWISHEDWLFLWKLAGFRPKICFSQNSAFIYRIHGKQTTIDNLSTKRKLNYQLAFLKSIEDEILTSNEFSFWTRTLFIAKCDALTAAISNTRPKLLPALMAIIEKLIKRKNLTLTGSHWPKNRKVSQSPELFKFYINQL